MHAVDKHSIEELFSLYWFDSRYAEIYTLCVDLWDTTVLELAKNTGIARITIHNIVDRLIKKWFLETHSTKQNKRLIWVTDPSIWEKYQKVDEKSYQKKKLLTSQIQSLITTMQSWVKDFTDAIIYKGDLWVHKMLEEIVDDRKTVYLLSNNTSFANVAEEKKLLTSYQQRFARWVKTNIISLWQPDLIWFEKYSNYGLNVRVLPSENKIFWAINIRGDKVAIHDLKESLSTITINNSMISRMFMHIWDILWELSLDIEEL